MHKEYILDKKVLRPVIKVLEEKCVNCHRCIMVCPVKMCNNGAGAIVDHHPELCIGCGECISACTHGARIGIDDFEIFMDDLKKDDNVIAVVAPAVAAAFESSYLKVNGFLKSWGIKAVFDVSFGAELTIKSYLAYMKAVNPPLVIAQPCSTLVSFIEIYRPELIPYLAPVDSPMIHTMKMIKRFYPHYKNHRIAAISPCYSKRREFDSVGIGDYNVTFRSIQQYLNTAGKTIMAYPALDYDNPPAERAVLFSSPGGLTRTMQRYDGEVSSYTRKIEGPHEVYRYLSYLGASITQGKSSVYKLIDCLNCSMGCNGGPGTMNQSKHFDDVEYFVEQRQKEMRQKYQLTFWQKLFHRNKLEKTINKYWEDGLYQRSYTDWSRILKERVRFPSAAELEVAFKTMRKENPADRLNCGACGYRSCEQMATAIINRLNKPENCQRYVEAEKEAQANEKTKRMINKVCEQSLTEMKKNRDELKVLSGQINKTADYVVQSSQAIERMVENVRSIYKNLEHNTKTVLHLNESSSTGKERLYKIGEIIGQVVEQSDALIDACKIIGDIAGQTSILGMNAAIEAAHAGDSIGKGFAVVAGEIRKLADNSGCQAVSITNNLQSIKALIDTSKESAVYAQEQFDRMAALIDTVKKEEASIQEAMNSQNSGGSQVLDSLNEINALIGQIKETSISLLASGESVIKYIDSLKTVSIAQDTGGGGGGGKKKIKQ
jgi:iron only hydrogenase large subunit-like protein/archaellum component FlaC